MSAQPALSTRTLRRPRPGTGFALVRLTGWLLKIGGGLLVLVALIGFLIMLVKVGPTLGDALQHSSESQFAGFVFLLSLTYLLIFPVIGVVGAILAGIGFLFGLWGMERVNTGTRIEAVQTAK